MKKIALFFCIIFYSSSIFSKEGIEDYRYYQIDKDLPNGKGPFYKVYIKKSDPCIYVDDIELNKTHRFCKMADSGIDLEKDYPSVYPARLYLFSDRLRFYVFAPWSEQKCEIDLIWKNITCVPTGK